MTVPLLMISSVTCVNKPTTKTINRYCIYVYNVFFLGIGIGISYKHLILDLWVYCVPRRGSSGIGSDIAE
jgi:hypothetical protein